MTRKKPPRGRERRHWYNNIPARIGHWTPEQRASRLNARDRRISWGKMIGVIGTVAVATLDVRANVESVQVRMAVMEAKQIAIQADIQRLSSYWGAPPPAFKR